MKWFCLVVFLLFGTLWVQAATENNFQNVPETTNADQNVDTGLYVHIKEMLEEKCTSTGVDSAAKNLSFVMTKTKGCLVNSLPKKQDELMTPGFYNEHCAERRGINRDCFVDLIHIWEDCTKEEEKYFAGFVLDALNAAHDYVCADNAAVITKVFSESVWDCVSTLLEEEHLLTVCDGKLKVLKDHTPSDAIFPKKDVCEDLYTAGACYGDYIKLHCIKDTIFREIVIGLFDAISSPCKKQLSG